MPKGDGKGHRIWSIPAIRARVVQGALKLILAPLCEAALQAGSYGYRPGRSAHAAVQRVAEAIVQAKTRVVDVALPSYFDNIRHPVLLAKVAQRIDDPDVMRGRACSSKPEANRALPKGMSWPLSAAMCI